VSVSGVPEIKSVNDLFMYRNPKGFLRYQSTSAWNTFSKKQTYSCFIGRQRDPYDGGDTGEGGPYSGQRRYYHLAA
jgi:hypothetical protein